MSVKVSREDWRHSFYCVYSYRRSIFLPVKTWYLLWVEWCMKESQILVQSFAKNTSSSTHTWIRTLCFWELSWGLGWHQATTFKRLRPVSTDIPYTFSKSSCSSCTNFSLRSFCTIFRNIRRTYLYVYLSAPNWQYSISFCLVWWQKYCNLSQNCEFLLHSPLSAASVGRRIEVFPAAEFKIVSRMVFSRRPLSDNCNATSGYITLFRLVGPSFNTISYGFCHKCDSRRVTVANYIVLTDQQRNPERPVRKRKWC